MGELVHGTGGNLCPLMCFKLTTPYGSTLIADEQPSQSSERR
jgi:hypothetical protein